jgi:hypothetical protein
MKKLYIACFTLLTVVAHAQKGGMYINFNLMFPSGEFKTVHDNVGYGGRIGVTLPIVKEIPLQVGFEVGYNSLQRSTQPASGSVWGFYNSYRVVAGSNNISTLLLLKLQNPKRLAVNPFIEGVFGGNHFYGTAAFEGYNWSNGWERIQQESTKGRWALTYGGAAGLDIALDKRRETYLTLKTTYTIGQKTTYYTDPTIDGFGQVTFYEKESQTNMVLPQVGFRIMF